MCQFLESRVIDTEDETYVEVTELRMADLWVEKSTSLSPRIVMEVEKDFSIPPETVM